MLSQEERLRMGRLRTTESRRLFAASHGLLRMVMGDYTGLGPAKVTFVRRCGRCGHPGHGKPRLGRAGLDEAGGSGTLEVSLTRSAGLVGVAVARTAVGLDLERAEPQCWSLSFPPRSTLERLCSPAELTMLAQAGPTSPRAFLETWVAKEAVGKARESGLLGLCALPVAPASAGEWRRVPDGADEWQVRLIDVGPDHVGAIATRWRPMRVTVMEAGLACQTAGAPSPSGLVPSSPRAAASSSYERWRDLRSWQTVRTTSSSTP